MKDYEIAAQEAARSNPDGWAVDPEAVLAMEEHLWCVEQFEGGIEAALEAARNMWKSYMASFRAGKRGETPGMLMELDKMGAALAARVSGGC